LLCDKGKRRKRGVVIIFVSEMTHGRFFYGPTAPSGPGCPHYQGFTITLGDTIHGRTPLDE